MNIHYILIGAVLLSACSDGGSSGTPTTSITTTALIINNSDKDIDRFQVTLNSNLPVSDPRVVTKDFIVNPVIQPGSQRSVRVDEFCDINSLVSITTGIFNSSSSVNIPCGSSNFQCTQTSFFDNTFNLTRYSTVCGTIL